MKHRDASELWAAFSDIDANELGVLSTIIAKRALALAPPRNTIPLTLSQTLRGYQRLQQQFPREVP